MGILSAAALVLTAARSPLLRALDWSVQSGIVRRLDDARRAGLVPRGAMPDRCSKSVASDDTSSSAPASVDSMSGREARDVMEIVCGQLRVLEAAAEEVQRLWSRLLTSTDTPAQQVVGP